MAGISQLLIEITGKDKASASIKQVKGSLGGLEDSARGMGKALDVLAIGGFAFAGKQAIEAAWDLGQLGAETLQLRGSFEDMARQTGGNADAMLSAIKRATSGAVSEYDAMLAANRGMMLGLGANADQWEQLVEVARYRAQAMGLSVTQALNDITTGIGRESRLILDNLGIILDLDSVMSQYAAGLGKTAEQLDAFERKQAIMASVISTGQAQIAAAGGITDTYATQIERMSAAMDDAKRAAGEALAPAIASVAEAAADAIPKLATTIEQLSILADAGVAWAAAALQGKDATAEFNAAMADSIGATQEAARIRAEAAQVTIDATQKQIEAIQKNMAADREILATENAMLAGARQDAQMRLDFAQAQIDAMQATLQLAKAEQVEYSAAGQAETAMRGLGTATTTIISSASSAASATDDLTDSTYDLANALWQASGAARNASDVYEYRRSQISNEQQISDLEQIKALNEEIPSIISAGASKAEQAWDNYYSSQQQQLSDLRSAVTAALQPTQVTQLDMDLSVTGDYVDKWDENARRLDAIAQRGFAELQQHADWASVLKIPPEVLSGSEAQLRDWANKAADAVRSLERPDLINLDAAVAAVEQYMQRQAAQELSIDLVVGEIAKRGGLSQEEAKRQVMAAYGMEEELPVPVTLQLAPGATDSLLAETGGALPVPVQLQFGEGGGISDMAASFVTGLTSAFSIAAASGDFRVLMAETLGLDQTSGTEVGIQLLTGITMAIQTSVIGSQLATHIAADVAANKEQLRKNGVTAWNYIQKGIVDGIIMTNLGSPLGELILRLIAQAVAAMATPGGGGNGGGGEGYTGGAGEP